MVRFERIRDDISRNIKVVDLQVSEATELPALGENVEGIIIAAGSIAQIIQIGAFATLDDDGKWYKQDGSGDSVTPSEG